MRPQLRQRTRGSWTVRIEVTDPGTSKRRQKRVTIRAAGKKEAEAELTRILSRARSALLASPSPSLEAYALTWIASKSDVEFNTHSRYKGLITDHLIPELGHLRIRKLSIPDVKRAVATWSTKPRQDGRAGTLSGTSVGHAFDLLRKILNDAVEEGLIDVNPCKMMKRPKFKRRKVHGFDLERVREVLPKFANSPFFLMLIVAIGTGLRRSEFLALRWTDVSLNAPRLSVRQIVLRRGKDDMVFRPRGKSETSLRRLPLPNFIVEALRVQLAQQQAYFAALGVTWTPDTLVFTNEQCTVWDPNVVSSAVKKLCEDAGVPEACLHVMRHSHSNVQREVGTDIMTIKEVLGHSSVATTEIYTDQSMTLMKEAASNIERVLGEVVSRILAPTRVIIPSHTDEVVA